LSVREFWKRWNTVIQKLLAKYVYKQARTAGVSNTIAISLTFLFSGFIHIWPIFFAIGNDWTAASSMIAYFVIQLSVMLLEKPLGVEKWDPWVARLWTLLNLFGPSYLLVYPCMKLMGIEF